MYDIEEHPDAPSLAELGEFVVEPVPAATIEERRGAGLTLVETNLREHGDVDAYVELNDPHAPGSDDIGTALYRLVQLFGTPSFPEYRAGEDITWRDDTTFKYLFEVHRGDEEWLVTVFDWHVDVGVGVAAWREDPGPDATVEVETAEALALLAVVANIVGEPVECEYEGVGY